MASAVPTAPTVPTSALFSSASAFAFTPSGQKIIWTPQPGPQTALIQCPIFEVFFGGARGGGKTESSLGDWLEHSSTYGEFAIGIFFRRKLVQLQEVIARSKQLFRPLGASYNEQKKEWRMPGGGRLKFAYLENDSDAEEYQGHNYTRVYIEEVTNFPSPSPINRLRGTLRSAVGVPTGMRLTGNPGGPGHNWVKARYIDPCPSGMKVITESTEVEIDGEAREVTLSRVFIPSKLTDNKLLIQNDPTYVLRLKQTGSEQLVRAWLNGDWSIIDGAFFDCFTESRHVLPISLNRLIPPTALRFRAFDWGSAKPFSCGWYAAADGTWGREEVGFNLPYGALLRYREWYGAKGPNEGLKMQAPAVAQGILELERGERIRYGVADPSIFIQNGGPSIAELMFKNFWHRGDNRRAPGWEAVRARLIGENGLPMLYFSECCEAAIRTIPTLQHDSNKQEDLDTDGEDHAADEVRYACMSRPFVAQVETSKTSLDFGKVPGELTVNDLLERMKQRRSFDKKGNLHESAE